MVSCVYQKKDGHLLLDEATGGISPSSGKHANTSGSHTIDDEKNSRTSDGQSMMHILKANVGSGILACPNAFKHVGLWPGFILVPIIGAICIHCMNILIGCHDYLCDKFNYQSLDYQQVASLSLACGPKFARRFCKWAHIVVTVTLIFTQVGFCCVYAIFLVENIQLSIFNLFQIHYSTTTYLLIFFPIIGLTSCSSNLKHLARISTLANILQLIGLALIFYDLLQFHTYSSSSFYSTTMMEDQANLMSNNTTTLAVSNQLQQPKVNFKVNEWLSSDIVNGLPLFFATAVYAFEGIGVVLPLIKEMEFPEHISGLNGVLNTSMSIVAILYMAMGFFGYAKYGQYVQGSITLNLPETTLNELARIIYAIAIGLSYSLQFYVPWTIIWPYIDESLFYSYRPREPRDKLDILNKLSAENEWALDESLLHGVRQTSPAAGSRRPSVSASSRKFNASSDQTDLQQHLTIGSDAQLELDGNSDASTFATSYAVSNSYQLHQSTARSLQRRHLNLSTSLAGQQVAPTNYGSTAKVCTGASGQRGAAGCKALRNRLEDVMEQEGGDSLPEIQWRPPPRSMRGKRKLVRYTVILLSVSFTFVAAALIPRLDLFIALIGALASSCLAIIFPAIIQTCTFWHGLESEADEENSDDGEIGAGETTRKAANEERNEKNFLQQGARDQRRNSHRTWWRNKRRLILWWLFIGKNSLLVIFGILGLITGSWISLSKLGAVYMGIDADEA